MRGAETVQLLPLAVYCVQFFTKGTASVCGMVDIINDGFPDEALKKARLMPRTEDLPLYTMEEFNDKVERLDWVCRQACYFYLRGSTP